MADEASRPIGRLSHIFSRERIEYGALLAEIVAALAIVISLVFVGLQIRGSNQIATVGEWNATLEQSSSFRRSIYQDEDTASILIAGLFEPEILDREEALRFKYLFDEMFYLTFMGWVRGQNGFSEPDRWQQGMGQDLVRWICTPGGSSQALANRGPLTEEFFADLEDLAPSVDLFEGSQCSF